MSELSNFDFLQSVMRELCSMAAQAAAYPSWDGETSKRWLNEIWTDADASMRKERNRTVTIANLREFSDGQAWALGLQNWDDKLRVIPLWMFNYVADGETLTSIDGSTSVKGTDTIDLDVRFGCIAYGFTIDGAAPEAV